MNGRAMDGINRSMDGINKRIDDLRKDLTGRLDSIEVVSSPLKAASRTSVVDSSGGFVLPSGARRSPYASWTLKSELPQLPRPTRKSYWHLCPAFVIELLSHADRVRTLRTKMREYIENDAQLGWMIGPDNQTVWDHWRKSLWGIGARRFRRAPADPFCGCCRDRIDNHRQVTDVPTLTHPAFFVTSDCGIAFGAHFPAAVFAVADQFLPLCIYLSSCLRK